jgi:choline dehydrogenase-like flavoprotein
MATAALRPPASADPFLNGLASGWKVIDASTLTADLTLDADVVIVGTGAGGGTAADILCDAGLNVVLVEEGPLATSSDFHMLEAEAYSQLYQESSARKTKDRAINILQGRCVGGGTTVNWTSSFRTPGPTLDHWAREFGIGGLGADELAPWFARMEQRLGIAPWLVAPNENNKALSRGTSVLGISSGAIPRTHMFVDGQPWSVLEQIHRQIYDLCRHALLAGESQATRP